MFFSLSPSSPPPSPWASRPTAPGTQNTLVNFWTTQPYGGWVFAPCLPVPIHPQIPKPRTKSRLHFPYLTGKSFPSPLPSFAELSQVSCPTFYTFPKWRVSCLCICLCSLNKFTPVPPTPGFRCLRSQEELGIIKDCAAYCSSLTKHLGRAYCEYCEEGK